jgi:MarR family transcriptional regulator, lower aerobic nicotinate degradation pathway regulator
MGGFALKRSRRLFAPQQKSLNVARSNDHGRLAMEDLYAKPGHLIRRVHQIHNALFTEECNRYEMTSVQYAALTAIQKHPDVDATRLSALIAFDRSTIGDVLERLESKGWVVRGPSPADRRIKLLRLTPAGATLLRTVEASVQRVQDRLLAPLAPRDRATMVRLLKDLADLHSDTAPQVRSVAEA